ncbi:PD-(D/E)XK nuclease family protein [Achromobacter xylosoxidans]
MDLIERVKISDDFLDVVSLTETQHSDMLAWCLHPNEGHGQGDAVIKDFLIAAYDAGQETNEDSNKAFLLLGRLRRSARRVSAPRSSPANLVSRLARLRKDAWIYS